MTEQPKWHEIAVRDAAPLLEVFEALDYVGSLELALNAVEKTKRYPKGARFDFGEAVMMLVFVFAEVN